MLRLIFFLLVLLFLNPQQLRANYSLFDSDTAQPPKPWLQGFLGVKSAEFRYDKRMISAAEIAASRAALSSQYSCWKHVKEALLEARVIESYPKTRFAKEAAEELQYDFGFRKLPVSDPYLAPYGSVLVYGGSGPGHIEFRTEKGFVSDFISPKPSHLPLLGIFVKPRS